MFLEAAVFALLNFVAGSAEDVELLALKVRKINNRPKCYDMI